MEVYSFLFSLFGKVVLGMAIIFITFKLISAGGKKLSRYLTTNKDEIEESNGEWVCNCGYNFSFICPYCGQREIFVWSEDLKRFICSFCGKGSEIKCPKCAKIQLIEEAEPKGNLQCKSCGYKFDVVCKICGQDTLREAEGVWKCDYCGRENHLSCPHCKAML